MSFSAMRIAADRARQAQMFAQRRAFVVAPEQPAPLQFGNDEIDEIIHCIDRENTASQAVARRLGAEKAREIDLFGHVADVWMTQRNVWARQFAELNWRPI